MQILHWQGSEVLPLQGGINYFTRFRGPIKNREVSPAQPLKRCEERFLATSRQ
jgi:hypothetical protein